MKVFNKIAYLICGLLFAGISTSCQDTKSYSELLTEEEHAVNWYLAQHQVCLEIPENGDFLVGEDAPFYKMDSDGFVYMQVINKGTDEKPKKGDTVYFRYMRMNIKNYQLYGSEVWDGNAESASEGSTSFVFGNNVLSSTTQYGDGIQVPLDYLGYDSEVNLIVKSPEGWLSEQSQCIPYLINIRYFKAIY
ncbi:MAG: DUF4827 domain-containing protein [Muribaculaceae bacterium]|nr:DUF4827 domain-containing protein [Muribaculaceae bacterium]